MATTLGGIGDAATARAYLESYRRAGVTLPAVRPITFPDAPWYRRTLEEAAALVRGLTVRRRCGVAVAVAPGVGCAPARIALPPDRRRPVLYVALGDSTVEGIGATSAGADVRRAHARPAARRLSARRRHQPRRRRRHLGRRRRRPARARDCAAAESGDPVDRAQRHHRPGPGGEYERNVETIFRRLTGETVRVVVVNLLPDLAVTPRFRGKRGGAGRRAA